MEVYMTPTGDFKNFKEINTGKFDFNNVKTPPGGTHEGHKIAIPSLRIPFQNQHEHSKSVSRLMNDHIELSTRKQPIIRINSDYVDDDKSINLNSNLGGDLRTNRTPSDCTIAPQNGHNLQKKHEMPVSQVSEIDDATEFTERQEFESEHIALESEPSLDNLNNVSRVHMSDLDQTELGN